MNTHHPDCVCIQCDPIWQAEIIRHNLGIVVA